MTRREIMELGRSLYRMIRVKYNLRYAHFFADCNRELLSMVNKCGCFFCTEIYSPSEIKKWTNTDHCDKLKRCAICPYCGIDSVIPENAEYPLSKSFLKAMKKLWFY